VSGDDEGVAVIANRRIRIGVYAAAVQRLVAEATFESGADVSVGDADADVTIPEWRGPNIDLISAGTTLHLAAGMRLHMCHDNGEGRIAGTWEELAALGIHFPLTVNVSKLNIQVREGVSLYIHFLPPDHI
jgi:hypothetical protein